MYNNHKAQATLEFTVMFVMMIILLFGLLSLWKAWCEKIIEDKRSYSRGRVREGNRNIDRDIGLGPRISPWPGSN